MTRMLQLGDRRQLIGVRAPTQLNSRDAHLETRPTAHAVATLGTKMIHSALQDAQEFSAADASAPTILQGCAIHQAFTDGTTPLILLATIL